MNVCGNCFEHVFILMDHESNYLIYLSKKISQSLGGQNGSETENKIKTYVTKWGA